ncbi:hypothetical protein DID77_04835, partial [Candidatus Marinamargulisbacteria bacterium SCGC AG-439-L15]
MLTGREKTLALAGLLKETLSPVYEELTEEHVAILKSATDASVPADELIVNEVLNEVVGRIEVLLASGEFSELATSDGFDEGMGFDDDFEEESDGGVDFEEVATILLEQTPQLTAFVLSRLNEDIKKEILDRFPPQLSQKVLEMEIAEMPISDKIYNTIYQKLFIDLDGESE